MQIIGLSSKMGGGKNYFAENVLYPQYKDKYNILMIGFADLMKSELYARDKSLSYDELYDNKTFESRRKLQEYGTEHGRDKYHQDIWIRGLDIQIDTFSKRCLNGGGQPMIIITDVRFKLEYDYIIGKGGKVIRIESPNRSFDRYKRESNNDESKLNQLKNHISETELDDFKFDYVFDNDYGSIITNIPFLFLPIEK